MSARVWFGPAPLVWGERVIMRLPFGYEIERLYGDPISERIITRRTPGFEDVAAWYYGGPPEKFVAMIWHPHGSILLRRR